MLEEILDMDQQQSLVSAMAENLIGSEIIKLAGEINDKIKKGEKVFNFTIGDFDPAIFPIPTELTEEIIKAYHKGQTNYPPANGIAELRKVVSDFLSDRLGLKYSPDEVLISGGARPLIYSIYITLLNAGDKVIVPVPSWNNNHYCHLVHAAPKQSLKIISCPPWKRSSLLLRRLRCFHCVLPLILQVLFLLKIH
jgi:aspartate aminotransferase